MKLHHPLPLLLPLLAPLPPDQDDGSSSQGGGPPPLIEPVSELVGWDVENEEGTIGEVRDLYLNPRGQVVYYVLRTFETGLTSAETYAVPAVCLVPDAEEQRFLLDVTLDRMESIGPFDPSEQPWPAQASDRWCERADAATLPRRPAESRPVEAGMTLARHPAIAWDLDDLLGSPVTLPDESRVGEVEDVGIDLNAGRVGFWILSTDGGADLVAAPWEALSFFQDPEQQFDEGPVRPEDVRLVVEATTDQLERAPEFDMDDEDAWIAASTEDWLEQRYEDFGVAFVLYRRNVGIPLMR